MACFEWTSVGREIRCFRMRWEGLPFPDHLTVGPGGGGKGQGERFQGVTPEHLEVEGLAGELSEVQTQL
ncbi:hypothetical protein H671_3g9719 [Cricetulus griseus]|nr:hypothetical protein H671_3g9719 [Cricetulus griseus]